MNEKRKRATLVDGVIPIKAYNLCFKLWKTSVGYLLVARGSEDLEVQLAKFAWLRFHGISLSCDLLRHCHAKFYGWHLDSAKSDFARIKELLAQADNFTPPSDPHLETAFRWELTGDNR